MHIVGILLAAGAATRFGGGKLLARIDGVAIGRRACANLLAVTPSMIAVVRPGDESLAAELAAAGARVTVCADAATGMGASLAHGTRAAAAAGADAIIVALADMPWIARATYDAVTAALAAGHTLVVPRLRQERGHPVGFARAHFAALSGLAGDGGARAIIAAAPHIHWIDVDDPGVIRDVDTPADLAGAAADRSG